MVALTQHTPIGVFPSYETHIVTNNGRRRKGKNRWYSRLLSEGVVSAVLPMNLNIESMFENCQTGIRSRDYIDKIAYFINTVCFLLVTKRHKPSDYQEKSSRVLREVIGNRNDVCPVKQACIDAGILETDGIYYTKSNENLHGKSYGYRLTPRYRNKGFKQHYIDNPGMAGRLGEHRRQRVNQSVLRTPSLEYLCDSLETFDFTGDTLEYLWQVLQDPTLTEQQKACRLFGWEWLKGYDRNKIFTYSENTGRLFTNITLLAKDLRSRLTIDGEPTAEIDLGNSQPYLIASRFKPGTPEIDHLHEVVSNGQFYETLNEVLDQPYQDRGKLKVDCYRKIFFNNQAGDNHPLCQAMWKLWPTVAGEIELWRETPRRTLACNLQRQESSLILEQCVPQIQKEFGCPIATVHDSFVVPCSKCDAIRDLLREVITEKTGLAPMLKVKGGSK